jgi:hypothetical protein
MFFQVLGEITHIEVIAKGLAVKSRHGLRKRCGKGNWRKLKGTPRVLLPNGTQRLVEIHWYEAHGIGKKGLKIKKFLD